MAERSLHRGNRVGEIVRIGDVCKAGLGRQRHAEDKLSLLAPMQLLKKTVFVITFGLW